jgi:hypothetical protein
MMHEPDGSPPAPPGPLEALLDAPPAPPSPLLDMALALGSGGIERSPPVPALVAGSPAPPHAGIARRNKSVVRGRRARGMNHLFRQRFRGGSTLASERRATATARVSA